LTERKKKTKNPLKIQIKEGASVLKKISACAVETGMEVYAVGGFVRDLYMGREGTDIDFAVVGDALKFARAVKKKYRGGKVVAFPRFGTAMLQLENYQLEFVTARQEHYRPESRKPRIREADLLSDLTRRDFTINCLAMHISEGRRGEIIDTFGGIADIDRGVIRTPLDAEVTFNDDPLRIMRAIRFATQLQFKIEDRTYRAILETRERLRIISQERITEEFRKILLAARPSVGLNLLQETGIMEIFLPEVSRLGGVEQRGKYHHKDVFYHTLEVVDNISKISDKFELRLAALFHDIAKPQTKRFVEGIGWTFHGHEELGARMMNRIGRRLRLPVQTIKSAQKIIRLHLRPMQLVDDSVTDSAIRRLMVDAGEGLGDLMKLCRADITSKNPAKVRRYLANFDRVEQKIREVEEKDRLSRFRPALTGNEIMEILNIPPGPRVGKIKQRIVDAILDGVIPNENQACQEYLRKITAEEDFSDQNRSNEEHS